MYEDSEIPSCYLRIDSPPILPDPEKLPWKANIATYDEKVGFVPASLVDGGDAVPTTALNAGERVDIEGMTFEAPSEGEFTVTFKGHQFTVNDKGEFVSDAYPFEQDSNGYGQVGTVCGELDAGNLGRQKVYAQVDGTNCRKAMDVLDQYVNHEWTMEERNSRGILKIDGWKCSVTEPEILQMPDPDARRLQCRDLSGTSRVILFNADKPNVPDLMPY